MASASDILPIDALREDLLLAARSHRRLIVTAPTGAGKSTRVPMFLADDRPAGAGRVICLQPRRLAARMLARQAAMTAGGRLGAHVGYRVRFDQCAGPATRVVYETDGILLQELRHNRRLRGVAALVFDEFHERHIFGDVLLGLAIQLQRAVRPDLLIVVMSATPDLPGLQHYLAPCKVLASRGRCFPVEMRYLPPGGRGGNMAVWDLAAAACAHNRNGGGHTLVFMPGGHEIRRTLRALRDTRAVDAARVFPLHGGLSAADQDAAVAVDARPRVIVATNIAETSITIPGVTRVIDSGLARRPGFDPVHGINTLLVEKISRASAEQRAGRAGRTAPGVCFRLWNESEHQYRPARDAPEVESLDLGDVVLRLRALGVKDMKAFPWPSPPPPERLRAADDLLRDIGALRADGELTGLGRRMADLPLHPRWSRLLLAASEQACVSEAVLVAAMAQERPLLPPARDSALRARRAALGDPDWESDVLASMRAWNAIMHAGDPRAAARELGTDYEAASRISELHDQLREAVARLGLPLNRKPAPAAQILKTILAAFPDRVARRLSPAAARVAMVHDCRGSLSPDTMVKNAALLVAPAISRVEPRRGVFETRISMASAIDPGWLRELFPAHIRECRRVAYDRRLGRVTAALDLLYHDLTIMPGRRGPAQPEEAAIELAAAVMRGDMTLKHWSPAVEQWITRLNCLARWRPELGLPPLDEDGRAQLIALICHGAAGAREVRERPVMPLIRDWLSAEQRLILDRYAPESVRLPNGRRFRLTYENDQAPYFSARIQELYDVPECPAIARGKVRVRVRILAPNQRPVQITDDLASFWTTGYERARKELRGRYPKHEWR